MYGLFVSMVDRQICDALGVKEEITILLFDTEEEAEQAAVDALLKAGEITQYDDGTYTDESGDGRFTNKTDALNEWQTWVLGAAEYFHVYEVTDRRKAEAPCNEPQ